MRWAIEEKVKETQSTNVFDITKLMEFFKIFNEENKKKVIRKGIEVIKCWNKNKNCQLIQINACVPIQIIFNRQYHYFN